MQSEPFWQMDNQALYPMLRGRRNADAVVVGGGLSGFHIAYWLCKAGLRVVLLEAATLGSGASGRSAGLVTQSHGTTYTNLAHLFPGEISHAYTQTQTAAFQSLRDLAAEQEMDSGWQDRDAFLIAHGEKDSQRLKNEHDAMVRGGLSAQLTQATQCPFPTSYALQLHGQATVQPYAHLLSLARKATRLGLAIFENSRVTSLETNLIYTQRGSVLAPYVIIATGYPLINTPGWYFLRMYQKTSFLFPMEDSPAYEGIFLDINDRFSLRRHREGSLLHSIGSPVGTHVGELPLQRFATQYAPFLENARPTQVYGGLDAYTADGLPFIGPYSSKTPNIFVAGGFGHHGILHSVVAAQAISAKILGLPGEGYAIYRGQRGGQRIWAANAKTTLLLAGRYARSAFRLHAPYCSHMGCKLVYRSKTKTWECPCHGARFDDIGRVLSAPAVHDSSISHKRMV